MEGETVHVLFEAIPECHCGAVFNGFREAYDHITTETIARLSADRERLYDLAERLLTAPVWPTVVANDIDAGVTEEDAEDYQTPEERAAWNETAALVRETRRALADIRGDGR